MADIWAKTNKPLEAFLAWTLNSAVWVWLYHKKDVQLSTVGACYSIICYLGTAILGVWFFNEPVTLITKIGLLFGLLAIIMISYGS
jgi:multidrug transporter EmrE-like cation transporter